MSSGTWCLVRDLGLVKGGKGMRHFEPIVTFSIRALVRSVRKLISREDEKDAQARKLQGLR